MTPTQADYEKLARPYLTARGEDPSDWVKEQVERIKSANPGATVDNRGQCAYVQVGTLVHYFDNSTGEHIEDAWTDGEEN